jgi:hypothetical protein
MNVDPFGAQLAAICVDGIIRSWDLDARQLQVIRRATIVIFCKTIIFR